MATIEKEKAIDVVKQMVADGQVSQEVAEKYFPELKESEDEKVRKWIIENIQETLDVDGFFEGHKTMAKNAIAWLEKQGEQKPAENKGMNLVEEEMTPFQKKVFCIIDTTIEEEQGLKQVCDELLTLASNEIKQKPATEMKSPEESLGIDSDTYNKIVDECIYGEQKSADKIKPKFKVDDWIIKNDDSHINIDYICCKIIKVENGNYTIESIYGYKGYNTFDTFEKDYHLWTIQDAKDGDVLACDSKHGQEIGIVKKYIGKYGGCDSCFETYCFVDWDDIFRVGEYMGSRNIHPATKEQRDLLFKKMKEAGYEFDFEKKELKKISQRMISAEAKEAMYGKPTAWSEEDESMLKCALDMVEWYIGRNETKCRNVSDWLKSLKDRVCCEANRTSDCEEECEFNKKEEPVSEDLEKAAKEWLRPQLDKSYVNYGEVKMMELTHFDGYAMLDAIEFGARWQQEKDSIPAEYLEELINKLNKQFPEVSFAKLSRIVVRVSRWQQNQDVKNKLPKVTDKTDLDEYAYQCAYDMSNDWAIDNPTWHDVEDACKLGAKWQEKQDQSTIELAEDHAYFAGRTKTMDEINEALLSEVLPCFMHGGEVDEVVAKLDEVLNQK